MKTKRILAAILSALMLMSCVSFTAGATEEPVDGEISLFDFLGEEGTAAIEEAEEAVDEPEEVVDEVEETVDEPEEAVDEVEETVDEPEEAVDEFEETVDEPEEAVDESEEVVDEPEEAVDEVEETVEESEEPSEKSTKKKASKKVEAEEEASLMEEAVEEINKVYLSDNGDDAKDGLTAGTAVQTIGKALEIMNANTNISTIVIVDAFHITGNLTLGTSDKRDITIMGNTPSASFHLIRSDHPTNKGDYRVTLSSSIEFENITLNGNHNDGGIIAAGKTLTFGTGVTRYAGDNNFGMNVAAESGSKNEFYFSGGSIRRLSLAKRSGGTYEGVTNATIDGNAKVESINLGHGWHTVNQGLYGTANVVIDGGTVSNIILGATGETAAANYSGLRYFTINDGVVGSIETTGSSVSKAASGYNPETVTVRDGVTVFEINAKDVIGSISKGKNKNTKAYEEDDAIRIILFNNDSYEEGKVSDDGAIVVDVEGGEIHADVDVADDYTATLNGYTFITNKAKVNINGTSYDTASLGNKIPADMLEEGYNLVIFDDIEISTVRWVVGETVTEQYVAVGSKLTPPANIPNPTKEYYYTFIDWTIEGEAVNIDTYTVPAGNVTITALLTEHPMPFEVVKDFETVYAMMSGKEFTSEKVKFKGVDGVKAIYSKDTSLHTKNLTFEGYGQWPDNYSVTGKKNHINTGVYEYVAIKYYYVPGTNITTRNIAMWIAGTNETHSTAMETNKWTYVVYELSKSGTSGQYHIRMAEGVNIGTLAANNEEFYIDTLTIYKNAPTVATITFKGEDGATLYAIDAINGEKVEFYSENDEQPKKDGYEFRGWAVEGTTDVVDSFAFTVDTTLVPVFEKIVPTTADYTIETYTMGTDGVYGEAATETKNATVGDEVNCLAEAKIGFTVDTDKSVLGGTVAADGSLVLKVYYDRNQYKLYTKADAEAEAVAAGTYYYDESVTPPATPTKIGHTFAGWTPAVPTTMPAENVTVTAQWTVNKHNVIYTLDGEEYNKEEVEYGTIVEILAAPAEKTGYSFSGWSKTESFTMPDENVTITGTYIINKYPVTFKNGEKVLQTGSVAYGTMPEYKGETPTKAATAQYTYTFAGWTPAIVAVTGEATYEATFTEAVNEYNVTFKNGEEVLQTGNVAYGTMPEYKGEPPTKAATAQYTYTFAGWTPAIVAVTGEATYEATFTEAVNKYTVTWIVDGKTTTETYEYGATPTFKGNTDKVADAQYTYTFDGWDKEIVAVAGNATYTAKYTSTVNKYTVTWVVDGKTTEETYEYGATPSFDGSTDKVADAQYTYTFAGWTPVIAEVTGNATYTATYTETKNSYTVTWKNGDAEVKTVTDVWGTAVTAPEAPTKTGYTFDGWDKAVSEIPAENVTVNAKWTINKYTITFNTDGGSAVDAITADFGTAVTAPAAPVKTGYTFAGWDKEIPATIPAENITITALWTINQYTITFANTGDTTIAPITQDYATAVTAPADPAKLGYTFAGWDNAIPATMPAEDMTITAQWTANDVGYSIHTYMMDKNGETYTLTETTVPAGNSGAITDSPFTYTPAAVEGFTLNTQKSVLTDDAVNADSTTLIKLYYDRNVITIYYTVAGQTIEQVVKNDQLIDEDHHFDVEIKLPVLPDEVLDEIYEHQHNGQSRKGYKFYWKKLDAVSGHLLEERNEALESNVYYLPGDNFTVPSEPVEFTAYWDYSDAELVLAPNASKAVANDHEFVFDIYLESAYSETLTKFESGEFTLDITTKDNTSYTYELTPNANITFEPDLDGRILVKRTDGNAAYLVPEKAPNGTDYRIYLGAVKVTGAGEGTVTLSKAVGYRHVVDGTDADHLAVEFLVKDASESYTVEVPTATLKVTVDFKNIVTDNVHEYQDMTMTISGGDLGEEIVIDLGKNASFAVPDLANRDGEAITAPALADGKYVVTLTNILAVNRTYNIKLEGAGYRSTRYTVSMTADKELYFWNNVMDNVTEIETGKPGTQVTFLAGDIVKDSEINIYDLSAVVSYFGEIDLNKAGTQSAYTKYDLNRDGKIDSKDVAYVLVSWGK